MKLDKDQVRQRLLARRDQLLSRYQGAVARIAEELDTREIEQVENSQELWDARVLSTMSDADAHALQAVIAAQVRLQEDEYGVCVDCGEEIDPARLEAIPEALRCVADEEKHQQEHGVTVPSIPGV